MSDYQRISVDTEPGDGNPIDNAFEAGPVMGGIGAVQGINQVADASGTIWDMVQGDTGVAEGLTDVTMSAVHLGSQAGAFVADPVGTLAAWGLDILLGFVQPLQDALDWVSGSPSDMEAAAAVWQEIAQAEVDLSQAVVGNMQPLSNWHGQDGAAAKLKTDLIAAGFFGASVQSNEIAGTLATAQILAEVIQSVIKYLISQLIKYFITEIAPMILASPATFGASAATGVAWASVRAAQTATSVAGKISQVSGIFGKLMGILAKIGSSDAAVVAIDALRNSVPDAIGMSANAEGEFTQIQPGMGPGLTVDPEEIEQAGPVFDQIAQDATGVASVVATTAQEDLTWGLCGLFFASDYNAQTQTATELMNAAAGTVEILAGNITAAAEDWKGADEELAEVFNGIEVVIIEVRG